MKINTNCIHAMKCSGSVDLKFACPEPCAGFKSELDCGNQTHCAVWSINCSPNTWCYEDPNLTQPAFKNDCRWFVSWDKGSGTCALGEPTKCEDCEAYKIRTSKYPGSCKLFGDATDGCGHCPTCPYYEYEKLVEPEPEPPSLCMVRVVVAHNDICKVWTLAMNASNMADVNDKVLAWAADAFETFEPTIDCVRINWALRDVLVTGCEVRDSERPE